MASTASGPEVVKFPLMDTFVRFGITCNMLHYMQYDWPS